MTNARLVLSQRLEIWMMTENNRRTEGVKIHFLRSRAGDTPKISTEK
jgi:hypothetical protein